MSRIRLIVIDIDGCLTAGEAQPWDLAVIEQMAALNRRARQDPEQWAVTLCTGRPAPYLEAAMQAIDAHLPGIYENGGGMYVPTAFRFAEHPAITPPRRAALAEVRRRLERAIVDPGLGFFQPGKEVSFSLYPLEGVSVAQLGEMTLDALGEHAHEFVVDAAVSCVDVLLQGIDKGAGCQWLSAQTQIALAEMAGIGDAPVDLPFLSRVGLSAAPANATSDVQRAVQYVSPLANSAGVLDIVRWMEEESVGSR